MDKTVTYLAHNNDLYEITFLRDGEIIDIIIYPDNNGQRGIPTYFWKLPEPVRDKIRERVTSQLEL